MSEVIEDVSSDAETIALVKRIIEVHDKGGPIQAMAFTGPLGIGKTRLLLEQLIPLAGEEGYACCYVDLADRNTNALKLLYRAYLELIHDLRPEDGWPDRVAAAEAAAMDPHNLLSWMTGVFWQIYENISTLIVIDHLERLVATDHDGDAAAAIRTSLQAMNFRPLVILAFDTEAKPILFNRRGEPFFHYCNVTYLPYRP